MSKNKLYKVNIHFLFELITKNNLRYIPFTTLTTAGSTAIVTPATSRIILAAIHDYQINTSRPIVMCFQLERTRSYT